jgi:hypothetical protein
MVLNRLGKYRFETAASEYMLDSASAPMSALNSFSRLSGVTLERESPGGATKMNDRERSITGRVDKSGG